MKKTFTKRFFSVLFLIISCVCVIPTSKVLAMDAEDTMIEYEDQSIVYLIYNQQLFDLCMLLLVL